MEWILLAISTIIGILYIIYDKNKQISYKDKQRYKEHIKEILPSCYSCKRLKGNKCNKQKIEFEDIAELIRVNECEKYKPTKRRIKIMISDKKKEELKIN